MDLTSDFNYEYKLYRIIGLLNQSKFDNCQFELRYNLCDQSNFTARPDEPIEWTLNDMKENFINAQYILIIITPIICTLGIVTNVIIVATLSYKKNQKELKDNTQYDYLRISSIANAIVLLIQIVSLVNKCQASVLGIYCFEYREIVAVQLMKIILAEYFSTFFILISNLSYFAFAIVRLSLIGQEHGKFVTFVSELEVKKYAAFMFVTSGILSVIKAFKYQVKIIFTTLFGP